MLLWKRLLLASLKRVSPFFPHFWVTAVSFRKGIHILLTFEHIFVSPSWSEAHPAENCLIHQTLKYQGQQLVRMLAPRLSLAGFETFL